MKTFRFVLALTIVIAAMGFAAVSAKAGAFSYYESSINLQNLDNTQANISLIFYRQDGTVETTVTDTVPANGQKSYFPLPAGVGAGFNGSVVVTSTTNVASISNVRGSGGVASGSYVAQNSGATSVALPVLMKGNGKANNNTWFNVQNAGSEATNVTVTYSDSTTASFANLQPGAAHTFDQAAETHSAKVFAGTVTTTQPVVVTVIQETTGMILASNGFTAGATNPVMPLINVQPTKSLITGVNMTNMGTVATNVTVTYTSTDATPVVCTETQTIQPKASATFALFVFDSVVTNPAGITTDCDAGSKMVGSARVTTNSANQPLSAIVNQQKGTRAASAYASFNPNNATGKFVVPLVMDRNGPWDLYTSINVMNAGTAGDVQVKCTFTGGVAYSYTSPTLGPGEGAVNLHNNVINDPYVGGATCIAVTPGTSTPAPGAKIMAVINQMGGNPNADQMMSYEAINVP